MGPIILCNILYSSLISLLYCGHQMIWLYSLALCKLIITDQDSYCTASSRLHGTLVKIEFILTDFGLRALHNVLQLHEIMQVIIHSLMGVHGTW